jgi:hypothetical protein
MNSRSRLREDLLGLRAVARQLGTHESSVRRMVERGELSCIQERSGARLLFTPEDVSRAKRSHPARGPGRPRAREGDEDSSYLRVTIREARAWNCAARAQGLDRTAWLSRACNLQCTSARLLAGTQERAGSHPVNFRHSARAAVQWDEAARRAGASRVQWIRAVANDVAKVRR